MWKKFVCILSIWCFSSHPKERERERNNDKMIILKTRRLERATDSHMNPSAFMRFILVDACGNLCKAPEKFEYLKIAPEKQMISKHTVPHTPSPPQLCKAAGNDVYCFLFIG